MQFTTVATVAALAATVAAWPSNSSSVAVDYVTEVLTSYTTYCPEATKVSFNGITYTITEATVLTVTNCPCTVVKPVTTSSVVAPTTAPVVYSNSTATKPAVSVTAGSVGTTSVSVKASSTPTPSAITASGGNKLFAMSGASLAGLLGLAVYLL